MDVKQGEIYWVKVKYIDAQGHEQQKDRPYVIVSRNSINRGSNVVGVPLTSRLQHACAHRISIPIQHMIPNPASAKTLKSSVALTDHIRVLDKKRLEIPSMGSLSDTARGGLEVALSYIFDIR